jgi:uncharacterized protein
MAYLDDLAEQLVSHMRGYERCVVAFSGGVDSALVAKAAHLALGENARAVTAVSSSLAEGELVAAQQVARDIGISHEVLHTQEFANPSYVRNEHDRCYHCKSELYDQLTALSMKFSDAVIANGTNTDDQGDFRPGLQAADEHRVRSPLAECGLNKAMVRSLAEHWALPVWNKPAMPCLSSRVAYGEEVTPQRLRMIDQAEQYLREQGFAEVRVRYHRGDLARLEVPVEAIGRLVAEPLRARLAERLSDLGFRFVTIDLLGFRSGSLNKLVPLEILERAAKH